MHTNDHKAPKTTSSDPSGFQINKTVAGPAGVSHPIASRWCHLETHEFLLPDLRENSYKASFVMIGHFIRTIYNIGQ